MHSKTITAVTNTTVTLTTVCNFTGSKKDMIVRVVHSIHSIAYSREGDPLNRHCICQANLWCIGCTHALLGDGDRGSSIKPVSCLTLVWKSHISKRKIHCTCSEPAEILDVIVELKDHLISNCMCVCVFVHVVVCVNVRAFLCVCVDGTEQMVGASWLTFEQNSRPFLFPSMATTWCACMLSSQAH